MSICIALMPLTAAILYVVFLTSTFLSPNIFIVSLISASVSMFACLSLRKVLGSTIPVNAILINSPRLGSSSQAAQHRASRASVDQQMVAKLASAHERLMAKLGS
jgi:hypothetical protein